MRPPLSTDGIQGRVQKPARRRAKVRGGGQWVRQAAERDGRAVGETGGRQQGSRNRGQRRAPSGRRAQNGRPSTSGCREGHAPTDGLFEAFVADTPVCRALRARRGAARKSRPRTSEPSRSAVCNPLPPSALPPSARPRFSPVPSGCPTAHRSAAETRPKHSRIAPARRAFVNGAARFSDAYKLCARVLHLTKSNKCCIIYINYLRTGSARRQRTDVLIPTNTVDKNIF